MFYPKRLVFERLGEGGKYAERAKIGSEKKKDVAEKLEEKVDPEASAAFSRLEKIMAKSYRRYGGDTTESIDVVDKVTGVVRNFDVRVISPEKVRIRYLQTIQTKKSFFGETQVTSSETVDIKDLLNGKVPPLFKPLSDELLLKEKENKLRESNRLIENGDGLKYQITKCYDDAMDQLMNVSDVNFLSSHKTVAEFRSHFNERFMKIFKATAVFSDFNGDITAKAKGITVIYKRGTGSVTKVTPAIVFGDEHYGTLDGMYTLKESDIARKHEDKHKGGLKPA